MITSNPDVVNSCRVCRSPNQDGDYECLYQISSNREGQSMLSEAGKLYENLLDISLNMRDYYPQFLCNSCDLQMKLFKKLKDKAHKTLEFLESMYQDQISTIKDDINDLETLEEYTPIESYENVADELYKEEINVDISNENKMNKQCQISQKAENTGYDTAEASHLTVKIQPTDNNFSGEEIHQNPENTFIDLPQIKLDLQQANVIDKNDYVTEIYELMEDEPKSEIHLENADSVAEYDENTESRSESVASCGAVEYLIEEESEVIEENNENKDVYTDNKGNINRLKRKNNESMLKKREYKCGACKLEFNSSQEYKSHRILVHNKKYPCSVCSKELKTSAALYIHMKIHSDQPAFQCEICQKTFNQKAHYQYHMNRHNNVRNFKCSECEKAFLSKTDLKVHMRSHTGHRPYVCDICGKDYLMMEHLKAHSLTHTEEKFQCNICNHKFATHKTLRTHIKSIHEDGLKFKCSFCPKSFRRKHHLEYHLKMHQKGVKLLGKSYDLIDDPALHGEVDDKTDDLVDTELIDDSVYVVLIDDVAHD